MIDTTGTDFLTGYHAFWAANPRDIQQPPRVYIRLRHEWLADRNATRSGTEEHHQISGLLAALDEHANLGATS